MNAPTEPAPATLAEALGYYTQMVLIRRFEERAAQLRALGLVPGFLHPYIGQEAVAVGVCSALEAQDVLTSTHRGHGHMLARGADPSRMYAELFARVDGCNKAKGGSLHMIDKTLGFLGANGIVGGGIPLAAGAALQLKRQKSSAVAVSFFGDGATNEGSFHETLNLASLWRLPVLFVCENNLYGEFTRQDRHQTITDIADRASSYAMKGVVVDGNDVFAMREAALQATEQARHGGGPTLIEAKTYRHKGHFEGDMARYRPKDEVEAWMRRDPIILITEEITQKLGGSASDIEEAKAKVETQLDDAIAWAKERPHPLPEDALDDVFANSYEGAALL
ncbi:MAG: thiamine pyrophosphate-dependent dehydrogenase E1 component subunit alpha [Actinobacteria bacterium]|nr:thiamine pyrophosphate-dependent dehydrogenase E1 component subunit alpha [Actinomycetota bacterium]